MRPTNAIALSAVLLSACAAVPREAPVPGAPGPRQPAPFSTAASLDLLPAGWTPFRITRLKKPTDYRLVSLGGEVALRAVADASASGVRFDLVADLRERPWLTWRWKVPELNPLADNTVAHAEDSPARVIVVFEGGREALPEGERANYDLALALGGAGLPYATLMYIWENRLPEGTIIDSAHTTRVKMIVAASGEKGLNAWREVRVNLLEDYRRAFGEEPPRVRSVGVMSDADNTGARTVAYFGDIRLERD